MLTMKPGDTARRYAEIHANDIDPETGGAPVILFDLANELLDGELTAADEIAHNYEKHGIIETGNSNCGPACRQEAETG